jgi:hypothetical protein
MKKFFASLLNPKAKQPSDETQLLDPNKMLFTVPTLSHDIAPLEPLSEKPGTKDFGLHEDEWCQIEFFPHSQLKSIQNILREYKPFEQAHRFPSGWNNVYVRKIQRLPVLSATHPLEKLEELLGVKSDIAPFLFTSNMYSGRVKNGFTLPLGGNITIYGYVDNQDIPVLGASVGRNPDDSRLTNAFLKLNRSCGVFLVDWRAQLLVLQESENATVEIWRP